MERALLKAKKQIILQGPPGTGKTRLAKIVANAMQYDSALAKSLNTDAEQWNDSDLQLDDSIIEKIYKQETGVEELSNKLAEMDGFNKRIKVIQFHPAYSYEDFVRGITVGAGSNGVSYEVKDKVLATIAREASNDSSKPYVLIIDEINRANLPSVLGELIYALEYRGKTVESMYAVKDDEDGSDKASNSITLPENLYIIGTMNTADRSVGHIDYAIRRRFAFVEVLPREEVVKNSSIVEAHSLFIKVAELFKKEPQNNNSENSVHLSEEFSWRDIQLGHSYFLAKDLHELEIKLKYEIKAILIEYLKDGVLKESARSKINDLKVGNGNS